MASLIKKIIIEEACGDCTVILESYKELSVARFDGSYNSVNEKNAKKLAEELKKLFYCNIETR